MIKFVPICDDVVCCGMLLCVVLCIVLCCSDIACGVVS